MINDYKDKIYIGLTVKNYKTMLELLQEKKKKNGDNRAKQEENWHRFFNWKRDGNKFIITEVYDEPEIETIQSDKGKYINYFAYILINMLRKNNGQLLMFKDQYMENMRIKSITYINYCKNNPDADEVYYSKQAINQIFDSCIKQMEHKNLIRTENLYYDFDFDNKMRQLDEEDMKIYKQIKADALCKFADYMNLDAEKIDLKYIAIRREWELYNKILNKMTEEVFSSNVVCMKQIELVTDANYVVNKKTVYNDLNKSVCDRIYNVAMKRKNKKYIGWKDLNCMVMLNDTGYVDYESYAYNSRNLDCGYEMFTDDKGNKYPISNYIMDTYLDDEIMEMINNARIYYDYE